MELKAPVFMRPVIMAIESAKLTRVETPGDRYSACAIVEYNKGNSAIICSLKGGKAPGGADGPPLAQDLKDRGGIASPVFSELATESLLDSILNLILFFDIFKNFKI
jgi:hypothetical protein